MRGREGLVCSGVMRNGRLLPAALCRLGFFGALLLLALGTVVPAQAQYDWRQTQGQTDDLNAVTVASTGNATARYVAVGAVGLILSSPDGGNWTIRSSGTTEELFGVAYGNISPSNTSLYLAVGANGTILQSNDGQNWLPQTPVSSTTLRGIIFANNEFVAFGDNGLVMLSPDGVTWTTGTTGTTGSVHAMAYLASSGLFVAVGAGGIFLTSPDALSWSVSQTGTEADLNSVVYGNGLFVAGGSGGTIMTASFSGNFGASIGNWQKRVSGTANTITSMVYNGTTFVGVTASSETLLSSGVSAGVSWVRGDTGAFTKLNALAYDSTNTLFVTVGDIGIDTLDTSYILTSTNAINWTSHASAGVADFTKVANNGSVFVAVGKDEEIESSPEGVIWNVRHFNGAGETLNAVYSTGARTVAVGNGIAGTNGQPPVLFWSDDGLSWSSGGIASFNGNVSLSTFRNVTGVTNNGTIWLGVQNDAGDTPNDPLSEAGVITSVDGKTWNGFPAFDSGAGSILLNPFIGVVWEPLTQLYVAILGPSSSTGLSYYNVRTSPDGINWSSPLFTSSVALTDIKVVNGQVVILFDATIHVAVVYTPTLVGGVEKLVGSTPFISTENQMRDVTYGADPLGVKTYVFMGDEANNDIDAMFTNTDAKLNGASILNSLNPNSSNVLEALDFMNGTFVGVGTGGAVYISKAWGPSLSGPIVNEGGVLSGNTTLTVQPLPFQPADFLSYQWQSFNGTTWANVVNGVSNGTTFSGNTTPILGIANITLADVIPYRVLVTNGNGTTLISNNATITLGVAPVINQPPLSVGANVGGSVSFSVVATGSPAPTFRWRQNGVLLSDGGGNVTGSNTSTLVFNNVQLASSGLPNSAGVFSVDVTNIVGTVSASANLTVGSPPAMVLQPVSQNPTIGGSVTFTSSASGTAPLSYQWYLNGVAVVNGGTGNISGNTSPILTISTAQFLNLGNYTVLVSNAVGNVTSNVATFMPIVPLVTIPPANNTVVAGATVTMNVTAVGLPTLTYQWLLNGAAVQDSVRVTGSSTTSLLIKGVQGSDAGNYTVKVGNGNGNVTSAPGLLQISPAIAAPPSNTTVTQGESARLSVTADGSGNVTYQWFFNGTAIINGGHISGNNTPTLNINNVQASDAGNYTVKVTNAFGNVTSIAGLLTVLAPSAVRTGMDWREMEGELNGVTVASGGNATNLYVAVGNIGTLLTSPDGANWTLRSTGTTEELFGAAFGLVANGTTPVYLAVGANGTMLQSGDGVSWLPQVPVANSTLRGVIFANNEFVAFGDGGIVMSSPDGVTWAIGTTGTTGSVRGMSFLPSLSEFVAVGDGGLFLTSVDGLAWTLGQTGAPVNLNGVAFGNGVFVAVGDSGNIVTASFGASNSGNWQARTSGTKNRITGVVFDGGRFLGVTSSSETVVSSDGVHWARGDTGLYTELTGLLYDSANLRYVAVGHIGINPLGTSYILTSTDGNTWADRASAQTLDLKAVTHGLGTFVAVGANESIDTSPDGALWTVHIRSLRPQGLNDVKFGAGEFMAVGDGVLSSISATAYRSFDGVNWSFMNMPTTNSLHGVAKGPGNVWVAVGDSQAEGNGTAGAVVLASTNQGASWSVNQMPFTNPFHGIVYDEVAGQYVAILGPATTDKTPADVIAISPDGLNWTFIYATTEIQFSRIERDNGFNVVVATNGKIFVVDPAALSVTVPFTSTANVLRDVTYGNDAAGTPTWVVVGDDAFNDIDAMFTNTANNPATSSWNSLDPQAFSGLQALDYSNGTFVAVGDSGRIFISKAWPPSIVAPVVDQAGFVGGNTTFTVEPLPSQPAGYLTFQWQAFVGNTTWTNLTNGVNYTGVTTPLLTITNITLAEAVPYRVLLTGSNTTLTSNAANIILSAPPAITLAPVSQNTTVGGNVTFTAAASGLPPPTFSWRRNGVPLSDGPNVQGSATNTLVLTNVQLSNSTLGNSAGNFTVTATNNIGAASASANLTVQAAPVIVTQPLGVAPNIGTNVSLNVVATAVPAPTYQWYFNGLAVVNGGNISGAQTSTLSINTVQTSNFGAYTVIVSNPLGNVTSATAAVGNLALQFVTQPVGGTVKANTTLNLVALAVGLPTPTYQWFLNGNIVSNSGVFSGATNSTLTITGITAAQGGSYYVVATSGNATKQSNTAAVAVSPLITGQPVSQSVVSFSNVKFTVKVVAGGTTTYQWYFEATKATKFVAVKVGPWIKGPTTTTLTITRAGAQFTGKYYVIVKNAAGTVQSSTVTLTIKPKPA